MHEKVFEELKQVFKKVFHDPMLSIALTDAAKDVAGWDSLTHMMLINEIELHFKIVFSFEEVTSFKSVNDMVDLISKKLT
jgi:acyl carrier protein